MTLTEEVNNLLDALRENVREKQTLIDKLITENRELREKIDKTWQIFDKYISEREGLK